MEINWVPQKKINVKVVNDLLQKSQNINQFTNNGPNVKLLEQIIKDKLQIDDTKAVIAVTNGSAALHSLASAIEYYHQIDINWATQSFTFPPSAQGNLMGIKIVDIDLDGGINLDEIDESINGIIVTNIFGNVVDIQKYEKWARENSKFLIFDNAATPFTFYQGKSCCNYGSGSIISFHHTKPLGFGEGGAIIVDKKYEKNIRCLNNFGINLTDNYWVEQGNNNKMSDISAAYIIQYLNNFNHINQKHKNLYAYLEKKINSSHLPLRLFPSFHDGNNILVSCFCLLFDIPDDSLKVEKNLLDAQIYCRKYYHPLKNTKNSKLIYDKILCLPCTIDMKIENINSIMNIIKYTLMNQNLKIFCIGLNKTGTTSMTRTFQVLGYQVGNQRVGELLMDDYLDNTFENIVSFCYSAEFFQDLPFSYPETFKYLDQNFPNAKFILTVRDNSEEWYNSLYNFHQKIFFRGKKITSELMKSIKYVYQGWNYKVFKVYNTPDDDLYNKDILMKFYESHNKKIIDYFQDRNDKLLVINLKDQDAFHKMINFLGIKNTHGLNNFYHLNKT